MARDKRQTTNMIEGVLDRCLLLCVVVLCANHAEGLKPSASPCADGSDEQLSNIFKPRSITMIRNTSSSIAAAEECKKCGLVMVTNTTVEERKETHDLFNEPGAIWLESAEGGKCKVIPTNDVEEGYISEASCNREGRSVLCEKPPTPSGGAPRVLPSLLLTCTGGAAMLEFLC